jgi:hypothetical protein
MLNPYMNLHLFTAFPDGYTCTRKLCLLISALQAKSKKGDMSLKEAIDESENLTDFLMDFEEDE